MGKADKVCVGKFQKSTKARRAIETRYDPIPKVEREYVSKRERAEVAMWNARGSLISSAYSPPDNVRGNHRAHVAFTRLSSKPKR